VNIQGTSLGVKGWSKRVANMQARQDNATRIHAIDAVRQRHYAAQAAGFKNAEEHEAHLASLAAAEAAAEAPAETAEAVSDEPAAETAPETEAPVSEPVKKGRGRKAAEG
jgi:hypothetical protein